MGKRIITGIVVDKKHSPADRVGFHYVAREVFFAWAPALHTLVVQKGTKKIRISVSPKSFNRVSQGDWVKIRLRKQSHDSVLRGKVIK